MADGGRAARRTRRARRIATLRRLLPGTRPGCSLPRPRGALCPAHHDRRDPARQGPACGAGTFGAAEGLASSAVHSAPYRHRASGANGNDCAGSWSPSLLFDPAVNATSGDSCPPARVGRSEHPRLLPSSCPLIGHPVHRAAGPGGDSAVCASIGCITALSTITGPSPPHASPEPGTAARRTVPDAGPSQVAGAPRLPGRSRKARRAGATGPRGRGRRYGPKATGGPTASATRAARTTRTAPGAHWAGPHSAETRCASVSRSW